MSLNKRETPHLDQTGQAETTGMYPSGRKSSLLRRIYSAHRLYMLPVLIVLCTLLYYFGELIDWAAWNAVRSEFFYSVHDVHRLVFLAPIIYAGYYGRVKGAIIITLVTFMIFLPRAFFISPYPDPFLRMLLFTIIAGVVGILTGATRNETDRFRKLEALMRTDKARLLNIIDSMSDGVLITGPDYTIRFMNSALVQSFGKGVNNICYRHLYQLNGPCEQCTMINVINEKQVRKREYRSHDNIYDVVSAPYTDNDGVTCQLSIFRQLS
jgi:PAS domain-containing protein